MRKGKTWVLVLLGGVLTTGGAAVSPWARAQEAATGIVSGTVYDSQTGNVLRGVAITAGAKGASARSDVDGRYSLKLEPGHYGLRAALEGYFDQTVQDVAIVVRKTAFIDLVLVPKSMISEKVVVTADTPQSASVKSVLLERRTAQTIMDNVSAEEISKNPDSNAAGILERVTGISVVDDKYVFVRGLGERYSNTMLNGSILPSTEPEKKVVPFDLFPSTLINKISTLKTFTPDQPGDFSGGLVRIDTVEFPAEAMMRYSVGVGFNTNVSTRYFRSYRGSHRDWLGFGAGSRRLPDDFPDQRITRKNEVTGSGFDGATLQRYGRELKNEWEARDDKAAPEFSQSFTGGGTYKKLGSVFSMTYGRKFARLLEDVNSYTAVGGALLPYNNFMNDKNTEMVKLGFVGNLAYKLSKNHKLQLKSFYTRDASDEVRVLEGFSAGNSADERDTRLRYVQEGIFTTQASGEHYLPWLRNSLLEWRMAYSRADRNEPDMRETIYRSEQGKNQFLFSSFGQSGFRQFTGQFDRIYEPGVDWSYFLIRDGLVATFKFGGLYHDRARDFSSRRFVFATFGGSLDFRLGAEKIFAQANITPDKIELREITRSTDTYDASHEIYAGYGMADVTLGKKWRFIGGLRAENSRQNLRTFDPFAPNLSPIVTRLETTDPLPSASVVYSMQPSMNLRAGFSRTLNRPEFRELAPFQFTDISGRSTLYGNPNLQRSRINNVDVRWEWFRGEDLFAASFFHKAFDHPIERVLFYAGDVLTSFYNTDRATNNGLELEVRKNLGFLSPRLATWSVYSNYSRIASDVRIGDIPGVILTSKERPLQGQAGYIFNCVAEFTHPRWGSDWRVLYNLVGPRISEVGATLQPDVYEQPNHFLDLSFGQRFKRWERIQLRISAQNLLDRPITHLQGSQVFYRYSLGRTFSLGLSFDVF